MSTCAHKGNLKQSQTPLDLCCFFEHSAEPVCLRNSQSEIIFYNKSFAESFFSKKKQIHPPLSTDYVSSLSKKVKIFLSTLELECAFLSSSVAQSRNIIINNIVWQVRVEILNYGSNVYFLWQFNKFYSLVNLIDKAMDCVYPGKYVDLHDFFSHLTDREIMVLPFYFIGYSYVDISLMTGVKADVVRKRVFSAMKKMKSFCNTSHWRSVILAGKNLFYLFSIIKNLIDDDISFL